MTLESLKRGKELETLLLELRQMLATIEEANTLGFGWSQPTRNYPTLCHHCTAVPQKADEIRKYRAVDSARLGDNQLTVFLPASAAKPDDGLGQLRNIFTAAQSLMVVEFRRLIEGYEKELASL